MTEFLHHSSCPNCNSKDNLGVWEDHSYCFGCGYIERNEKSLSIESMKNKNKKDASNDVTLPSDSNYDIPERAWDWLDKYGITDEEVYRYKLSWSERLQRLIFPCFGEKDSLLFWQGRYFGDREVPRYLTQGKGKDVLCFLGRPIEPEPGLGGTTVICCEDFVSSIKIGRKATSLVLFGSVISTDLINRLSRTFSRLGIWLDRDKAKYALNRRLAASVYFDDVFTIITEKDPKCYSDEEIEAYIRR